MKPLLFPRAADVISSHMPADTPTPPQTRPATLNVTVTGLTPAFMETNYITTPGEPIYIITFL